MFWKVIQAKPGVDCFFFYTKPLSFFLASALLHSLGDMWQCRRLFFPSTWRQMPRGTWGCRRGFCYTLCSAQISHLQQRITQPETSVLLRNPQTDGQLKKDLVMIRFFLFSEEKSWLRKTELCTGNWDSLRNVLIHSDCCKDSNRARGSSVTECLFLDLQAGRRRSGCQQGSFPAWPLSLTCPWPSLLPPGLFSVCSC